jgi:hypothetical protein
MRRVWRVVEGMDHPKSRGSYLISPATSLHPLHTLHTLHSYKERIINNKRRSEETEGKGT